MREAARHEDRIDALLHIAHQQERAPAHGELEHDRDVVDARAVIGGPRRDAAAIGPKHAETRRVDGEAVARGEMLSRWARPIERSRQGDVARARTGHPRLEEVADAVAPDQSDHPGRVVLVGVREDDDVDAAVPRGHARIEHRAKSVGVRTAVDEDAPAARSFDEDRVPLADVEDGDAGPAVGTGRGDASERDGEAGGQDRERKEGAMSSDSQRSFYLPAHR